jgi:hypothetical protein
METVRIRDPGWKKVGSGIRDKHPGCATLILGVYNFSRTIHKFYASMATQQNTFYVNKYNWTVAPQYFSYFCNFREIELSVLIFLCRVSAFRRALVFDKFIVYSYPPLFAYRHILIKSRFLWDFSDGALLRNARHNPPPWMRENTSVTCSYTRQSWRYMRTADEESF